MRLFGEGLKDRRCSPETVSSYIDGALPGREMQRMEAHLASCPVCAELAEELRSVVSVLRAMPTVPAPRSFAVPVPAAPAPAFVFEPARRWWQPSPMAGLRAAAVAAALALAVVFTGDLSGVIGTPGTPDMLGLTETSDFVTPGNPPGPEQPQVLGPGPVPGPETGPAPVVEVPDVTTPASGPAPAAPDDAWLRLELWPLEVALLAITAALAAITIMLRRRSSSA